MYTILQVGKYYHPYVGGMETAVKSLCLGITEQNYKVNLITFDPSYSQKHIINKNFTHYRCKSLIKILSQELSISAVQTLQKMQNSVDLIHIHLPNPLMEWALLRLKTSIPIICTYHCEVKKHPTIDRIYQKNILYPLLKTSNKIIVSAPKNKNFWGLEGFLDKTKVIPFGVKKHTPIEPENIAITKKPYLLFVGRLVPYKGLTTLIKAMHEIPIPLFIAGDGPEIGKLKKLVIKENLSEKVKILGKKSRLEIDSLIANAWAMILPSIDSRETFGISLIEALSFGIPLITSKLPTGVTDINKEGIVGLHTQVNNSQSISETVNSLLKNPELYKQFRANALEHYRSHFTLDKMIQSHMHLYQQVISN